MSPKESEKIGAVYIDERKRLLGYIRNRIPDHVEAEDILQDVFYQLTVGFQDIRRIESLTAWLYRVADNRITDLFRKKRPITISYSENAKNDEDGPLSLHEILPSLGSKPEDEEIKELARMVVAIENISGFPCDIEWTYYKGRFYFVQCRPITTL